MSRIFSTLLFLSFLFAQSTVFSQEIWSLAKCIEYALENNLDVKQADFLVRNDELTLKLDQRSRLPSLNASVSGGYQFGRTIDPTTNAFESQAIGFNSYQLQTGVTLFNGNRINNQIKQDKINLEASRLESRVTENNIALSVANAYLTILLAEEQLANARQRLALSETQLEQTDRLINAGALPANDRLDIVANIALNEQTIIDAQNLVTIGYLNLKDILQLDPQANIRIEAPQVDAPEEDMNRNFDFVEVYNTALQTQPAVRVAELRREAAKLGDDIARAGTLPTVSAFGSLSTNYSTVALDRANPDRSQEMVVANPDIPVLIDGEPVALTTFSTQGTIFPDQSFGDQINQNFGQSLGVSLNIPIYNNSRNKIAIERAQIQALTAGLQFEQTRQQLRTEVMRAIADFRSARESYIAAQTSVEAAEAAFDNAQRRFDLGGINSFELSTSRNNLDLARIEMTRAKYQRLFNLKVVQFYLGEAIELN